MMKIIKFQNLDKLSTYVRSIFENNTSSVNKNNIIITGGSSKNIILDNLQFVNGLTNVWWSDERFLHYRNINRNSFLNPKQKKYFNKSNIHFKNIPYYKSQCLSSLIYSRKINKVNSFDIGFFSLGADNHFASVFKNYSRKYLKNQNSFFPIINSNNQFPIRITLNPLLLNKVNQVYCLVIGENKKNALSNLLSKKKTPSNMMVTFSQNFTILTTV